MFFFEKKNQKTFASWRARLIGHPPKGIKVFCFFFSKKKCFLFSSACLLTASGFAPAPAQVRQVVLVPPSRAFGYLVGDVVELRVAITADADTLLDRLSLPVAGPVSDALELRDVSVFDRAEGDHHIVELRVSYQIFLAAEQVLPGSVPGYDLRFSHGGQVMSARVPEWSFYVSPLQLARRSADPSFDLRGNHAVPLLDEEPATIRMVASASLMVLAFLAWAGFRGWLPGFRREGEKPFASAVARIAASGEDTEAAYRALHGAFDATARRHVFFDGLDDFFRASPRFMELRSDILAFFNRSSVFFFTPGGMRDAGGFADLRRLAKNLRRVERKW